MDILPCMFFVLYSFILSIKICSCIPFFHSSFSHSELKRSKVSLSQQVSKNITIINQQSGTEGRLEGSALFNDALKTFLLWLYFVGHTVKDHSYSNGAARLLFMYTTPQTG